MLLVPPGHARPLPGRRDRTGRHRRAPRPDAGPARGPVLAGLRRSRRHADPDAVARRPRRRDSPSPVVQPWLPFGDLGAYNVEDQRGDPGSMLTLARDLIALRRATPGPAGRAPTGRCPLRLGHGPGAGATDVVVMIGMSEGEATLEGFSGRVWLGTDRRRDGERSTGELKVRGWEGVVAERDEPDADRRARRDPASGPVGPASASQPGRRPGGGGRRGSPRRGGSARGRWRRPVRRLR